MRLPLVLPLSRLPDTFDLLPGVQHLLAFGADNILQALERVARVGVRKTSVMAKRRLSIEIPDGDVTQQGLELTTAEDFNEGFGGRAAGALDGFGQHVRGDIAKYIARLGLVASTLLELGDKCLVVLLFACDGHIEGIHEGGHEAIRHFCAQRFENVEVTGTSGDALHFVEEP